MASGLQARPLVVTRVYNLGQEGQARQLDLVVITGVIYLLSNLCVLTSSAIFRAHHNPLCQISKNSFNLEQERHLFDPMKVWQYIQLREIDRLI